jgi:hypothetical protein
VGSDDKRQRCVALHNGEKMDAGLCNGLRELYPYRFDEHRGMGYHCRPIQGTCYAKVTTRQSFERAVAEQFAISMGFVFTLLQKCLTAPIRHLP